MKLFDLSGKTALVTGASRGIGRAVAIALAQAGADVVLAARSEETLRDAAAEVEALGRRAMTVAMDVSDIRSIEHAFASMDASHVLPTLLVNNAGTEQVCPSLGVTEDLWDRIVDTNLKGAFFVSRAFAERCVERDARAAIVNMCSLTSAVGVPTATPYTSSKSGLLGMTRALASEWAAYGIRVNAIGPGYFRTDLTEVFYRDEKWCAAMLNKIPMSRFGDVQDLAGTAIFLCSNASAYITGQLLYVDGGYMASI